jgi:hypothetical protein
VTLLHSGVVKYHYFKNCDLDSSTTKFNSFSIDSLALLNQPDSYSNFLFLGVRNFGIATLNLDGCRNWGYAKIFGYKEENFKVK